jgi:hypothetical protein
MKIHLLRQGKIAAAAFCLVLACAVRLHAADVTKGDFRGEAPKSSAGKGIKSSTKRKTYPFSGTIDTVNERDHTIVLKGKSKRRVIFTTSETRIEKDGKESSLAAAKPGDRITGTVFKNASGQEQAVKVRISESK